MKFADYTKLSGEIDTLEGRAIQQEDLARLEEWANKNLTKFNEDKCKVLHLGKGSPGVQHRLGFSRLGSSSLERDLGVLVPHKLHMNEQCAAVAKAANKVTLTRVSPGELRKSLSHSIYCLPGHIWNSVQF